MQPSRVHRRRSTAQRGATTVAPSHEVLALQRMAGNHAVASLVRKIDRKPQPPVTDKAASDDLSFALKYVDDFFEGVRDVLALRDKVRDVAIRNYVEFGKLKDPPSLSDAILGALFSSLVGLIPGGAVIKAGITTGLFALDMSRLKKDLAVMPIPGVSADEEKAKGPTARHTEKAGKHYDRGKTAVDTGKAVYDAVKAQREAKQAADEAEASAKEIAGLHHGRITDWTKGISDARQQEAKIVSWLRDAVNKGNRGGLEAAVRKNLGPIPEVTVAFQKQLEKDYELELYRAKYAAAKWVTTTTTDDWNNKYVSSKMQGGPSLSEATRRRIADLDGHPFMWEYPAMIAIILKLKDEHRQVRAPSDDRLKAGMKF